MPTYLAHSRSAYYSVVAALPLLLGYELLLLLAGGPVPGQMRNAADVWVRILLASLDLSQRQATAAMICALLIAIPFVRRRELSLEPRYFGMMLAEAVAYSVALRFLINFLLAPLFTLLPTGPATALATGPEAPLHALPHMLQLALPMGTTFLQAVALSLGAGLFEEFTFRVLLVNGLLRMGRLVFQPWLAATLAVMGAALLFSLAHYVGDLSYQFTPYSFAFRFTAGLLFTLLYYRRGFAIAAYSHAFYDIGVLLW